MMWGRNSVPVGGILLVAAGLALGACSRDRGEPHVVIEGWNGALTASSSTPGEVEMELEWEPTMSLVGRGEVQAAVDKLAGFGRIESAKISSGGTPSEVYEAFRELVEVASAEELEALLRHESGAVRGYMMQHIVGGQRDSLKAVRPLLRDETAVEGQVGCMLGKGTIASRTVEALCANSDEAEVVDMLEVAAQEAVPDVLRGRAVVCLAQVRAERGLEFARPMLRHDEGDVRRQAVSAFTVAGVPGEAGPLEAMATDEDRGVRAAVATAVARLGGDPAVVTNLLADEDHYVRMIAGSAYVEMGQVDEALVRRLLDDPQVRVRNGVAIALAEHGAFVHLLEPILMAPRVEGRIMQALAQREDVELAGMMRRLMAAESGYVRARATDWLGQLGDDQDLPLLQRQLGAPTIGERKQAARALGRRGDVGSVPLLENLLRSDENPHGRIAAAEALVAIRGEEARTAVEAALAVEGTWARTNLQEILNSLD